MKKVLVCGAGGFIGSHLVKRLTGEDLKYFEFSKTVDDFILDDSRNYYEKLFNG